MWSTLKLAIVTIAILIVILYFENEIKTVLLRFNSPQLLTSVGTILTAFMAIWLGLFGNKDTRLLIKNKEKELDQEAFNLLTDLPKMDDSKEQLTTFEKRVIESPYISDKRLKKYNKFIILARKFRCVPRYDYEEQKELFSEIIHEAKKLEQNITIIDDQTKALKMNILTVHEAKAFWDKNIFIIDFQITPDEIHPPVLIYSDNIDSGASCANVNDIRLVRQTIDSRFRERNKLPNDDYYSNDASSSCRIIYPSDYKIIKRNKNWIKIKYKNKEITLYYKKPLSFTELKIKP